MNAVVEKTLSLWGLNGSTYSLAAARENAVFRVTTDTATYALRLHRKGYRTDQELWSELKWMDATAKGGIIVPTPIPSLSGDVLHAVDGVQVDVLTWLSGAPIGDTIGTLNPANRADIFHRLGQKMARLHAISDAWPRPQGFVRVAWDRAGLLGENPLWGRFWENPNLSAKDQQILIDLRKRANTDLNQLETKLDYGLIHADLVSANVMLDGNQLSFIDFDDGGFGFRLFEIATTLLKFIDDPDYPQLRSALIKGYTLVRAIDLSMLSMFIALRAATYVGWNIDRMAEDGADGRNERFIDTARRQAQVYLASQPGF